MNYDLTQAVLQRPQMYTISGTYGEVVSFLTGFYDGQTARHRHDDTLSDIPSLSRWYTFQGWLNSRFSTPNKTVLHTFYDQYGDDSLSELTKSYNEYLASLRLVEQDETAASTNWMEMGLDAFMRDWDNPDDAVYDNWREAYGIEEG